MDENLTMGSLQKKTRNFQGYEMVKEGFHGKKIYNLVNVETQWVGTQNVIEY